MATGSRGIGGASWISSALYPGSVKTLNSYSALEDKPSSFKNVKVYVTFSVTDYELTLGADLTFYFPGGSVGFNVTEKGNKTTNTVNVDTSALAGGACSVKGSKTTSGGGSSTALAISGVTLNFSYEASAPPATVVGAPSNVRVASSLLVADASTTLSWNKGSDGTSNKIKQYQIQSRDNTGSWSTWANYSTAANTATSASVKAPSTPNVTRQYRVGSVNTASGFSTQYYTTYTNSAIRSKVTVGAISFTSNANIRVPQNNTATRTVAWSAVTNATHYYYTITDSGGTTLQAKASTTSTSITIPNSIFTVAGRTVVVTVYAYNNNDDVTGASKSLTAFIVNTPPVMNSSNVFKSLVVAGTTYTASSNVYNVPKSSSSRAMTITWTAATDTNNDSISYDYILYRNGTTLTSGTVTSATYTYTGVINTVGDTYTLRVTPKDTYNSGTGKTFVSSIKIAQVVSTCQISLVSVDTDITSVFYRTLSVRATCDVVPTSFSFQYSTNGGTTYQNLTTVSATASSYTYAIPTNSLASLSEGQTIWIRSTAIAYNSVNSSTIQVSKIRRPIFNSCVLGPNIGTIGNDGEILYRGIEIDATNYPSRQNCYKSVDSSLNLVWPSADNTNNLTAVSQFVKVEAIFQYRYNNTSYTVNTVQIARNTTAINQSSSAWYLDWNGSSRFNNNVISNVNIRMILRCWTTSSVYIDEIKDTTPFVLNFKSPPVFMVLPEDSRVTNAPNDRFLYSGQTIDFTNTPKAVDTNRTLSGNASIAYNVKIDIYSNNLLMGSTQIVKNSNGYIIPTMVDNYTTAEFKCYLLALDDGTLSSTSSGEFRTFDVSGTIQKFYIGKKEAPEITIYSAKRENNKVTFYVSIDNTGTNASIKDAQSFWTEYNNIGTATFTYEVRYNPEDDFIPIIATRTGTYNNISSGLTNLTDSNYIVSAVPGKPWSYQLVCDASVVGSQSVYMQATFSNGFYSMTTPIRYVSGDSPVFSLHKDGISIRTENKDTNTSLSIRDQDGDALVDFYHTDGITKIGKIARQDDNVIFTGAANSLINPVNILLAGSVTSNPISFDGSENITIDTAITIRKFTATFTTDGWSGTPFRQSVTVSGLSSTMNSTVVLDVVLVSGTMEERRVLEQAYGCVMYFETVGENTLRATCRGAAPTSNFTIVGYFLV